MGGPRVEAMAGETAALSPVREKKPAVGEAVVVTGAAGWLGGEVARQLQAAGWPVIGADRRTPRDADAWRSFLVGDLRDEAHCEALLAEATHIVHCAGRQYQDVRPGPRGRRVFAENVGLTRTLLDALPAGRVRHIVYVSTDMVYGQPRGTPVAEDAPTRPLGPYGASKREAERLCLARRDDECAVTILRPRLIIGPGRVGVLRRLFDAVRMGRRVPVLGDGRNRYQMVALSDVAHACVLALQRGAGGAFNLGSDNPPTVNALLIELIQRAGTRARLVHLPRRLAGVALRTLDWFGAAPLAPEQFLIAGADYVLDNRRARESLGWRPRYDDVEMLWQAYCTYTRGTAAG